MESQKNLIYRTKSFSYRTKTLYIISCNTLDAFLRQFSVCQVIQTYFEQSEPLKRLLNFFCGNESSKHVTDGKFDMKLSD